MRVDLSFHSSRLFKADEAARYLSCSTKTFLKISPVAPLQTPFGLRYDMRELDKWVESLKGDGIAMDFEAALERLK